MRPQRRRVAPRLEPVAQGSVERVVVRGFARDGAVIVDPAVGVAGPAVEKRLEELVGVVEVRLRPILETEKQQRHRFKRIFVPAFYRAGRDRGGVGQQTAAFDEEARQIMLPGVLGEKTGFLKTPENPARIRRLVVEQVGHALVQTRPVSQRLAEVRLLGQDAETFLRVGVLFLHDLVARRLVESVGRDLRVSRGG